MLQLFKSKLNIILVAVVVLVATVGFIFLRSKSCASPTLLGSLPGFGGGGCLSTEDQANIDELDLPFDPEGPYALLFPRRDGNALVLNLKRTASYDSVSYELAYNAEGIDRGVMGTIDAKQKKSELKQEILFGTCSKNVCKYDKGVENGTLTLHIRKDKEAYKMVTQWHLQQPEIALGLLSSGDSHFNYKLNSGSDLALLKNTIINDLSGAPKITDGKSVLGKVYSLNSSEGKIVPPGEVSIELPTDIPPDSKIVRFDEAGNKWMEYETTIKGRTLKAMLNSGGVITIFSPKKS